MDTIIELSYPVGYEYADKRHLTNNANINGQFIYGNVINFGENQDYIVTIKLDDFNKVNEAIFKDLSIKQAPPVHRFAKGANNSSLSAKVPAYKIQQVIDYVKSNFEKNPLIWIPSIAEIWKRLNKWWRMPQLKKMVV